MAMLDFLIDRAQLVCLLRLVPPVTLATLVAKPVWSALKVKTSVTVDPAGSTPVSRVTSDCPEA